MCTLFVRPDVPAWVTDEGGSDDWERPIAGTFREPLKDLRLNDQTYFRVFMIATALQLACKKRTSRKTKQFINRVMAHGNIFSNSSN